MKYAAIALAAWNLIVFCVYGLDKYKAKKDKWRIPEKTLLLLAFFFGGLGAFLGMRVFHHKTKHRLFTIGVPVCLLLNIAALYVLLFWHGGAGAMWKNCRTSKSESGGLRAAASVFHGTNLPLLPS